MTETLMHRTTSIESAGRVHPPQGRKNSAVVKRSGKWTVDGIKHGRTEMSYFLGIAYLEGASVSQDSQQAVRWLQRAASLGSRPAQARLGAFR